MESSEVKGICLICLKRFDLMSSDKEDIRYKPRYLTTGAGGFESSPVPAGNFDDIYTRFLHLSCRYLKLTSTAEVFLMAATSCKSETGESLQAFCENCKYLVSYVCDLYAELQALKLRLISKLALIEEVMEDRNKFIPRTLLSRLGMQLKEQLHVKSRMRVESFRMAFQRKCKSKLKNDTPKVLVPRGLLPEKWKFGYPACKLTLMRLIIIFALASSKILPSKENEMGDARNGLRPQLARRSKGRPKSKSVLTSINDNPGETEKPEEKKTEADGINCDSNDNQFQDDFELGGAMIMTHSAVGSDDEFKPDSELEDEQVIKATTAPPEKRWNLRKRKCKTVSIIPQYDSSDHDLSDHQNHSDNNKPKQRTKKSRSKNPDEPPKNLRGWPRVGDCEPSVPCPKCTKMFLDKRSVSTHLIHVHNIHTNYTCVHCGQKFTRWKDRQNHRKKFHPIKRTTWACGPRRKKGQPEPENAKKPAKLKRNIKVIVETTKKLQCRKCDLFFTTLEDLHQHKRQVHLHDKYSKQPKERRCPKCPEVFMSLQNLISHKSMAHGRPRKRGSAKCPHCPETFSTIKLMRIHRIKSHPFLGIGRPPVGPTKCLDCDKQFPTGKLMVEHRKADHKFTQAVKYVVLASGLFKCKKCDESFTTKELVLEHRKTVHKIVWSKHECPICYRTVLSEPRLKVHLKRHELFKSKTMEICHCEVCAKHFYNQKSLQDHMTKVHGDKYICYICRISMETGKQLRDHLVEHEQPDKYFYCMVCFQGFSNLQFYDIHRKITHLDKRRLHCDYNYCNEIVDTMEQLGTHMETHLGQDGPKEDTLDEWKEVHKCEKCDKPFIKRYNFTVHMLTHTEHNKGRVGWDCPLCDHSVKYMDTLISHYNRVHGLDIKCCKCYICDKGFYTRLAYSQHIRECAETQQRGEGEGKRVEIFICNFCGFKFDDNESLEGHKKEIHYSGELNELKVCPEEGCGEMRTSGQMNLHLVRAHGKGERYPCEKCGKSFPDVNHLREHLKDRHGEEGGRRHGCGICGKAYQKPSHLKIHVENVHGEEKVPRYCCHLCGLSYFSKQGLRYHNWGVHEDVYKKELRHKCGRCGRLYGRKVLLTAHLKNCKGEDKQEERKSTDFSKFAPVLDPKQMPEAPQKSSFSSTSATMSYHQWISTTAAVGLGGGEGQQQNFLACFLERPPSTQVAQEMPPPSSSSQQSEESLHQL